LKTEDVNHWPPYLLYYMAMSQLY